MTDPSDPGDTPPSGWSAPGGQWGSPSGGGYSPQPPSEPPGQSPGSYGPPAPTPISAQPGIIPLHPLTMGQIFDGAFKAIRANPMVMFVFAGVLVTISTIIELALSASFFTQYFSLLSLAESDPAALDALAEDDLLGMFAGSLAPVLLGMVFSLIISTILSGVLTFAVSQAVLGFKPTVSQVWHQVKGQILPLFGLVILITVLMAVVPVALVFITALFIFADSFGLMIIFGLLTLVGSLVWVLFVMTATVLSTPVLMLERSGPITALRRGWQLARPFFWRVLGIYLLTMILASIVTSIITFPASMAVMFLPPTGFLIAQGVATIIATTLVTPFVAAAIALLYIDIRIRREGLATELAAAAAQ